MTLSPVHATPAAGPPILSAPIYEFLQKHVHRATGILLDRNKDYLLEARLNPVLAELRLTSFDQLCAALTREPEGRLNRMVVDAMTTNETLFFRDVAAFEALRQTVLPDLLKQACGRKLRIWSSAASSGQEAYSLAMLLLEMGVSPAAAEIFGTDISQQILDKAVAGKYVQCEVNRGLPMPLLMRYFERSGLEWQVKQSVRQMVRFEQRDLRQQKDDGEFDLILCRNVLIYFDQPTKHAILKHLHESLRKGGLLMLGCAETIINCPVPLQRTIVQQSAFYTR